MAKQLLLAPPAQENLSRASSIALVQIFLNACLACISHTRELVPWTSASFRTRYIDEIDVTNDTDGCSLYDAFLNLPSQDPSGGQEIRILVRGGQRRADQMLDMLEHGVFEALNHGYLDTLQVFVTKHTEGPQIVLENYSFSMAYDGDRVSSIQLNPLKHEFLLGNVHKSFKAAIRALLRVLRDLPRVPARRKLGMSLTYNNACPISYQPPGFVDREHFKEGDAGTICDSLLRDVQDVVGKLETGHHRVNVGVTLQASRETQPSPDVQDTTMSKQLQAMQKTSSVHSTNMVSTLRDSGEGAKRKRDALPPKAKRLKNFHRRDLPSERQTNDSDEEERPAHSQDLEKPMLTTNGDEADSKTHSDPLGLLLPARKLAELLVHCYALQCGLDGGPGEVFDQALLAEGTIKRRFRSTMVKCECGNPHTSGVMLYCEICDAWQHGECYGHAVTSHSVLGERFCYTCLLFPVEQAPKELPSFIMLMRRAVGILTTKIEPGMLVEGTFLQTELKHCRWPSEVLDKVQSRLVEEGLLLERGQRRFQVMALSDAGLWRVHERYLSPMAGLHHLYSAHPDGYTPRRRAKDIEVALQEYSRGQDFTSAQGCEQILSPDDAGAPGVRWGYHYGSNISVGDTSHATSPTRTPMHRRKVSFSRMLISIDPSPSPERVSVAGSSCRFPRDFTSNTNFGSDTSTGPAD